MMTLTPTERAWLAVVGIVAVPYVTLCLGAIFGSELHRRAKVQRQAKAQQRHEDAPAPLQATLAAQATAATPVSRVITYCPECAKQALANRRLAMPPHGIQALCAAHSHVPVYLPEPEPGSAGSAGSNQNAQPLIRRIPVRFVEPALGADWEAEAEAAARTMAQRVYVTSDGARWGPEWFYVDPVDPVWN